MWRWTGFHFGNYYNSKHLLTPEFALTCNNFVQIYFAFDDRTGFGFDV